jgi:hypothetical protein
MPDLQFDDTKDFDENIEAFLLHMESKDANLGAILIMSQRRTLFKSVRATAIAVVKRILNK